MSIRMAADYMARAVERDGGFTARLDCDGGAVVAFCLYNENILPLEGSYVVGGAGPIKAYAFGNAFLLPEGLPGYIARLVAATFDPDHSPSYGEVFIGGWKDPEDGTVWIEPVSVYADESEADRVARARGEKAYQDLSTNRTVYVTPLDGVNVVPE